ncbi:MAG: nitrite reductase small subunit NirD [Aliiglaciecola sp.]|uniref:nitrite reductase small subunit NirD n=1 Tax=Aliiglaciecola sp. M165 TaxID=2593649 RepID=UPI00117EE2A3|nr:nitrite reductase small subunit NirD [Aliiglaciecola sp. M165]TRY30215.1 nitrite reductase small subunit NirD [Aliiglaciecola sp. M165]
MNTQWITICKTQDLVKGSGVCALVNGRQVALFNLGLAQAKVVATSNWDPIGKANVMYRGIIGSESNTPYIASPLHKQRYSLLDGASLDGNSETLVMHQVKLEDQNVLVKLSH